MKITFGWTDKAKQSTNANSLFLHAILGILMLFYLIEERNKTDAKHSKSHLRLLFFPLLDHTANASRNSVWSTVIGEKKNHSSERCTSAASQLSSHPSVAAHDCWKQRLTRIIKMSFPKIQRGAWMTAAAGRYARKNGVAAVAQGPPLDFWRESRRCTAT